MADFLDDHVRIIDRPVIGALLDHGDAEWPLAPPRVLVSNQRMIADLVADVRFVKRLMENRTDEPIGIAVGLEKNRNTATDEECTMMGCLVIVAVEQYQIALGDKGRKHDLVG